MAKLVDRLCSICGEFQSHDAKMYNDPQTRALICERCFAPMLPEDDQPEPDYEIPSPRESGVVYWDEIGLDDWEL